VPSITFLFKVVPGPAPSSFGLNVARMAHVDERVLQRAAQVAEQLREADQQQRKRREQEATKQAWKALQMLLLTDKLTAAQVQDTCSRIHDMRVSLPSLSAAADS